MAKQFSALSLFLLCLLAFQEMRPSEALMCSAPSALFTGLCFSDANCSAICEKEGFLSGTCKIFRCVCHKDCGVVDAPPKQGGGDLATRKLIK